MEIIRLVFNQFGVNTYIVYDPFTRECAIIDPGMVSDDERWRLKEILRRRQLKPVHLVNTHLHADHAVGNSFVKETYGLELKAHRDDSFLAEALSRQKRMFGMADDGSAVAIDVYICEGDEICIGKYALRVLEVPGHTPGGIALYDAADKFVITGDSLFLCSIGRTDLPGGDVGTLINSVRGKLLSLPDDITVYPGHGDITTIGFERTNNPFLK